MNEDSVIDSSPIKKYGWSVKLNHIFPEKRSQGFMPTWHQLYPIIPLIFRYLIYTIKCYFKGKAPVMDYVKTMNGKQIYGVPIGGIGCGTIGRGFQGEFCRYQLTPGVYSYNIVAANQFIVTIRNENGKTIYQQVLSPRPQPRQELSCWKWQFPGWNAQYRALYPQSWTTYKILEHNIILTCHQISPVIPHNYKDSSVPGAAFVWSVENCGDEQKDVSITFTFKNGIGGQEDKAGGCWNESFSRSDVSGVQIHQFINDVSCTYAIGAKNQSNSSVSTMTWFDPCSNGEKIWQDLLEDGELCQGEKKSPKTKRGQETAAAVCVKLKVPSGATSRAEFALAWDMPKIRFFESSNIYKRFYTTYFGDDGLVADVLCKYVLDNFRNWIEWVDKWQSSVLDDLDLPDWYKSALFNETYFVSDGGTIWLTPFDANQLEPSDPRNEYGHFGYLEGHEYRMYNTYDVHYYASFTLAKLWPRLQEILQYDLMDSILKSDKTKQWELYDGSIEDRKVANSVPHDLGDPYEDPFIRINAYPIHDVSKWRDLNLKFVLQCYRDWKFFKKQQYIEDMWPKICTVMHVAEKWDTDHDGLIENGGSPDQTYDSWVMTGPSAYCCSLWVAALHCTKDIASELKDEKALHHYTQLFEKAKLAFEKKLWNGEYYNFDSASNPGAHTIMADQLCGLWYLRASGVQNEVFIDTHVKSALKKIFDFNVMKFKNGTIGAVNGMKPDGKVDMVTVQSEEVWTGVVYGLAALMMHEGMVEEAFKTAHGVYNVVYNIIGMGFETPEALYAEKWYRAIGYMRPLSIWALQHAWELRKRKNMVLLKFP
ncbi:hypothetical protein R5R35_000233 [Gryllus longicercus]|uniref:Non-lysosomal glucosylceramidase n=1 Tax=Gryllus longicercus TaxID=2509291 RepID=A0AAN9Z933_9ORTH